MVPIFFIGSSCATGLVKNSPLFSNESSCPEHIRAKRNLEGRVLRRPGLNSTPLPKPSPPTPLPSDGRGWRRTLLDRGEGEGFLVDGVPRALPWAIIGRPSGAWAWCRVASIPAGS